MDLVFFKNGGFFMRKNQENYGRGRTRNFVGILYPESAPKDWSEKLAEVKIPALVSPLHKDDINADGSKKKPHYHIILMFDSVKTIDQAQEIFSSIGAINHCQKVNSLRGQVRYLCHLDNPEKAQYKLEDVKSFCGADFYTLSSLPSSKYGLIREMIAFCEEKSIYEYCELFDYAAESNESWFRCLCDESTFVMNNYLKSKRAKKMFSRE